MVGPSGCTKSRQHCPEDAWKVDGSLRNVPRTQGKLKKFLWTNGKLTKLYECSRRCMESQWKLMECPVDTRKLTEVDGRSNVRTEN